MVRPKRRSDDNQVGSSKKHGNRRAEPTYDTYDEALDGGVELEEKGERYKDGDRAQRFYEKALELYRKAYDFKPTFDAAYNQARVLYTLSTSFLLPPQNVELLSSAVDIYRHSMTLTTDPLLLLDAGYNLAETLSDLASIIEDLYPDRTAQVRAIREEACVILGNVFDGQERYLSSHLSTTATHIEDQSENVPVEVNEPLPDGDIPMDIEQVEDSDKTNETPYETHLPTPSSLIDTLSNLISLHLTLWETSSHPHPPTEQEQLVLRQFLHRVTPYIPPSKQSQVDLLEIRIILTEDSLIWESFKSQATIGGGFEQSLQGALMALTSLLSSLNITPPEETSLRAEILLLLSDTHVTLSNRLIHLNKQLPPGPSPLGQQAWSQLSESITRLTQALNLPKTSETPRGYKGNILLELSKTSLERVKLKNVNETAKRNVNQLIENARTYGINAISSLNWKGVLEDGILTLAYPTGWDDEVLAREIVIHQIRVLLYASQSDLLELDNRGKYSSELEGVLKRLNKLEEGRKIGQRDLERFWDDLEDDMTEEEKGWWASVVWGFTDVAL
ncbi:hypothetical protein TREMEDRAFT_27538 [Tremella mesenterica DSM 1558]|uniref:uncharacterized protein n=1 Tax=Tremella mesenterica (strain ATCC 24925 / CBS 8224 / DSM 1558 / NBRC 9311 / NRRL Y-6157 / RJB 2259-6 / UBC 559-6) TaxID=578456 RepID=UPI0003F496C1|nr:uncharacterized protein TREMEDRAFT_27538 [Tremella mesenterica DSM 1558]EIW71251.1 hypothetical protein TREMEDRAFT_27538 [Tremella mesenterica DSM 1558]